jgi:signal transduction histidine kinase
VRRLQSQTTLTVSSEVRPTKVVGDPDRLSEMLRNLTDNAARFAWSEIVLTLDTRPQCVQLSVEDDGPGIPEADRERVMERFVRLEDHRARAQGGAGLGLAIVREIVHAHEGTVRVEKSELGGAKIVVELPRR